MALTYEPIATSTLSSQTGSVTFSSIPNTYTDLVLVANVVMGTLGSQYVLQFNSDTGTNYSNITLYGDGSSVSSYVQTSVARIETTMGSASSSAPVLVRADIFNYKGTSVTKSVLYSASRDANGSGRVERGIGLWRGEAAITSVIFSAAGGGTPTLGSGTVVTLFGIKAA